MRCTNAGGQRWLASREARTIAALAFLAAFTRLAYWYSTRDQPLRGDALHYHRIAANVAGGRGISDTFPATQLHPTAFRPPLYPLVLGAWYRTFGSTEAAGRASAVLGGIIVVLAIYVIVRRHADTVAAVVAAVLAAVYPPLIANDTVTLAESLSLLILLLLVDALLARRPALAGLASGLLALTRPSAQLLILLVVGWVIVTLGWKRSLTTLGIFALVLVPWLARNTIQLGQPVLVTSNGFNLSAVYSKEAQNAGGFIDPVYDPGFEDLRLVQFDEAAWDAELRARAMHHLAASPLQIATIVRRNALTFSELTPSLNTEPERLDGRNGTIRVWSLPLFFVVVGLGVAGLWSARRSELARLLVAIAIYFTAASLAFVAPPRLRAPVDLALCIGVGLLVAQRYKRRATAARTAAVLRN